MFKKYFIIIILLFSLVANVFFIYSNFQHRFFRRDIEASLINTCIQKIINELSLEDLSINPFEELMDISGSYRFFQNIIDENPKLILIISDNSCGDCTEINLNLLKNKVPVDLRNNIIIIGMYERKRQFFLLSKQYPFNFFLLNEKSSLLNAAKKGPAYFVLEDSYKPSNVLFPLLDYNTITEKYLDHILENFQKF